MKPAFPFPSLRKEHCLSYHQNHRWQFFIPTDSDLLLQCCSCPPRYSGIQRWANAVLRKSQSGTDPSGSSSLVDMGPQGLVQSLKVGPVGYVASPTTHHQLEERRWTQRRGVKENLDRENIHQKV